MLAFVQVQERNRTNFLLSINKSPNSLSKYITGKPHSAIMVSVIPDF